MIVPNFRISQDSDFIFVHINVPYVRVSAAEMVCDGRDFSFWCKPYLLKLRFPHPLDGTDEERCRATYDPMEAHGTLVAHLPKVEPGLHFPDLDLTTKLLQMRLKNNESSLLSIPNEKLNHLHGNIRDSGPPGISILSSTTDLNQQSDESGDDEEQLEMEFETEEDFSLKITTHVFYGFNRKYSQVLGRFREEFVDVLELPDPEGTPEGHRRILRLHAENAAFDADRYLGDFLGASEDPQYLAAQHFEPFWIRHWNLWRKEVNRSKTEALSATTMIAQPAVTASTDTSHMTVLSLDVAAAAGSGTVAPKLSSEALLESTFQDSEGSGGFSEDDRNVLARVLVHRELLVSPMEQKVLLLGLLDLLFAYCYDHRGTEGEPTVESAHNITRMSALLSWLDNYAHKEDDIEIVITSCMRRACIYPYLRCWRLARKVLSDVARVLYLGKHCVLKCLLGIRSVFEHTDTHYMLNKVFMDDYCTWIQTVDADVIATLATQFNAAKNIFESSSEQGKSLVGLQIPELELWLDENGFDEAGDEQSVPSTFCSASRDAATASCKLLPATQLSRETNPAFIAAKDPIGKTLPSLLMNLTVSLDKPEAALASPVKAPPLIQEL